MFGIGPTEMLVIAAIVTILVSPLVIAGIVMWIVFSRGSRGPRE